MLSRATRHRLGFTVAGASSPSMKAYSPRFHMAVPLAVHTMPSGTGAISPRFAASKSRVSENGNLAAIAALAARVAASASRAASRCDAGTGTAERVVISSFPSSPARALCERAMAQRKLSLSAIRRAVIALPGIEEGTSYGTPAWRHKGRLLARLHQDGKSIVLKVGNQTRDHLLQADPETFFVTDQ